METQKRTNQLLTFLSVNFLVLFLLTSSAFAQYDEPRIGIKGGLNLSNLYAEDVDDENARVGFHAGITAWLPVSEFVAIQPELLYSTKGAKVRKESGLVEGDADFRLNYIDLPILAVFSLGEVVSIHAGVYGSYLLNAKLDIDSNVFDSEDNLDRDSFNSLDYGLVGGLGFNFSGIGAGVRYNYGLREVGKDNFGNELTGVADAKNSVLQLYVSFGL